MAIADYFQRGAVAVAQAVEGFDEAVFKEAIETTTVGIAFGPEAAETGQGRLIADLTTRIVARFYPKVSIHAAPQAQELADTMAELARRINPSIEILDSRASVGVAIGTPESDFECSIFAGADQWLATIGQEPQPVGDSSNPFGAGAAACLACANLFRFIFTGGTDQLDHQVSYSTYHGDITASPGSQPAVQGTIPQASVLVGAGAIGNAAAWALAHAPLDGEIYIVDPEPVELTNLQRYVLAERSDEGRIKVDLLKSAFTGGLNVHPVQQRWEHFVKAKGYDWRHALLALDSAKDRMAVQASLPENAINAWTQAGDLGVSVHDRFSGQGACVCCLYLPSQVTKNQDKIVAEALRIEDALQDVRRLLHTGDPPPAALLDRIAERLDIDRNALKPFENQPLLALYSDGICGATVISLDRLGFTDTEMHVPLAHQSALAGIQLAASYVRRLIEPENQPNTTSITRIDLLAPLAVSLRQPARKSDPRCICSDPTYIQRYDEKWPTDVKSPGPA